MRSKDVFDDELITAKESKARERERDKYTAACNALLVREGLLTTTCLMMS